MVDVRISGLPSEASPAASDVLPIDGATTRKTTIQAAVEIGRPAASQAEAEAGTDPTKVMTPLTVKQSIAVNAASPAQGALADSALQPSAIGVTVQAYSANLQELSGINPGVAGLAILATAAQADVRDYLDVAPYVATRTILKALDTTKDLVVLLRETGRAGVFQWTSGDFSAQIALDTQEGVFIKADAIAATSGAWVRQGYTEIDTRWCGAVNDGSVTDDRVAIQAAWNLAYFLNVPVAINGNTYVNSGGVDAAVNIAIERDFKVIIRGTVKAGPSLPFDGINQYRVFRITAGAGIGDDTRATVIGGEAFGAFDMSSAPPGSVPGVDAVSITDIPHITQQGILLDFGVQAPSGANIGSGTGGDSAGFFKDYKTCSLRYNIVLGAPDVGFYLSGDNSGTTALNSYITENYFYRCGNAIAGKRASSRHYVTKNTIFQCQNGILAGVADGDDDNMGREWFISWNDMREIQGDPINISNDYGSKVTFNTIIDWRRWISDGTTETAVSVGNYGGAVKLRGCHHTLVSGNTTKYDNWTAVSTANKQSYGVVVDDLTTIAAGTVKSSYVKVMQNDIDATYGGVFFDGAEFCKGKDNDFENLISAASAYVETAITDNNEIWYSYDFSSAVALSGGTGVTYDARIALAERRGRWLKFTIYIDLSAYTSAGGAATITGLPFASNNTTAYRAAVTLSIANVTLTAGNVPQAYIGQNTNAITLLFYNGSAETAIPTTAITTNSRIAASGEYKLV